MGNTFNRSITDDSLRRKKLQLDAAKARDGILGGYRDVIAGRTTVFKDDLHGMLKKARK